MGGTYLPAPRSTGLAQRGDEALCRSFALFAILHPLRRYAAALLGNESEPCATTSRAVAKSTSHVEIERLQQDGVNGKSGACVWRDG